MWSPNKRVKKIKRRHILQTFLQKTFLQNILQKIKKNQEKTQATSARDMEWSHMKNKDNLKRAVQILIDK